MDERHHNEVDETEPLLLRTIRIPKKLSYISDRLPKSNYNPLRIKSINRKQIQTVESSKRENSIISESYSTQENLKKIYNKLPQINKENIYDSIDNNIGYGKSKVIYLN